MERNASMVGADSYPTEVIPNPDPNLDLDELAEDGANEFLFVFTPMRLKGATGSAGRPIVIR